MFLSRPADELAADGQIVARAGQRHGDGGLPVMFASGVKAE
jgi:hypothetical protein